MADKTVYVMPSGGDYTTLQGAITGEVAANPNLTAGGMNGILNIEIGGTWSIADTTAVVVDGFTTDATHYVNIYTASSARHKGVWSSSYYQLVVANGIALRVSDEYVRVAGLQLGLSSASAHAQNCFQSSNVAAGATHYLCNSILKQAGSESYRCPCMYITDADVSVYAWNNILYGMGNVDNLINSAILVENGNLSLYSSTVIGGKYGIYQGGSAGTSTLKNVYIGGTITEDFYRAAGTLAKTNCASGDQSADDTGTGETATNCVAAAVAIDTDTFVNVTGGSEDFHLAADGNSPLEDAGVDTSGDSAPMNFTTDIDGDTITTYPIGADFRYVAASATNVVMNII